MMPLPRRLRAFTLMELMLAIALGLVLLFTAFAGFRVASQCIVVSNRLSTENALMRAGFEIAQEQLDFWTNLDDPNDGTRERLRLSGMNVSGQSWAWSFTAQAPAPTSIGLPFSPMQGGAGAAAGSFPANIDPSTGTAAANSLVPRPQPPGPMVPAPLYLPLPPAGSSTPSPLPAGWENDAGFDASYVWSANDPRTWFRGNPLEKWLPGIAPNVTPLIFGRYGAFTNITATPVFPNFTVNGPYPPPASSAPSYSASYSTAGSPRYPPHLWYGRQLMGLSRALGYYGLCDYLPANAMYGYYTTFSGSSSNTWGNTSSAGNLSLFFTFPNWGNGNGGSNQNYLPYPWTDSFLATPDVTTPQWATIPNGGWYWNFVGQGMGPTTMGIYALTSTSSYAVCNPYGDAVDKSSIDDNTLAWRCYSYSNTDYSATYNGNTSGAALGMQYFIATTLPLAPILGSAPAIWPQVLVGTGHYVKSGHFIHLTKIRWQSPLTGQISEISFNGISTTLRGARMQRRPGSAAGWAKWDNAAGAANDANLDGAQ